MVSEGRRQANGVERSDEPQERHRHAVYFLFVASIKPGKLKDVFPKIAPDCSTLASSPCSTNPPNAKPQIR